MYQIIKYVSNFFKTFNLIFMPCKYCFSLYHVMVCFPLYLAMAYYDKIFCFQLHHVTVYFFFTHCYGIEWKQFFYSSFFIPFIKSSTYFNCMIIIIHLYININSFIYISININRIKYTVSLYRLIKAYLQIFTVQ